MKEHSITIEYKTTALVRYDGTPIEHLGTRVTTSDIALTLLATRNIDADTIIRDSVGDHCHQRHIDALRALRFRLGEKTVKNIFEAMDEDIAPAKTAHTRDAAAVADEEEPD